MIFFQFPIQMFLISDFVIVEYQSERLNTQNSRSVNCQVLLQNLFMGN